MVNETGSAFHDELGGLPTWSQIPDAPDGPPRLTAVPPRRVLRGCSKHSQQKVHSPKGSEFQGRGAVKLTDGASIALSLSKADKVGRGAAPWMKCEERRAPLTRQVE